MGCGTHNKRKVDKMEATTSDRIIIQCKHCLSQYEMRKKDLRKVADKNEGWVPCYYCGNRNTTWDLDHGKRDGHDVFQKWA